MVKVTLIDPRGWQGAVSGYRPSSNVGIAYLVSSLRKAGYDVSVIDLNNEAMTDNQALKRIEEYHPDILGFSAKTATMSDVRSLAQLVKSRWSNLPIVIGGPHTIFFWRDLIKEIPFDVVFVGEGEVSLPEICISLLEGGVMEGTPGVVTKKSADSNPYFSRTLLSNSDLEYIPFPDYDLFPATIMKLISNNYPLVTSRGCVYKCTYCSVPKISGRKVRKRSPENIIEELRRAKKQYGSHRFNIIDDVFNIDMDRCKDFCFALIEKNLSMTWSCPNGLRADRIDEELAELMFKSGCQSVMLGVESIDPEVLKAIRKGETIEDIEKGIRTFQKAGIIVGGYFIIGLPGDSMESEKKAVEFTNKLGINAHFNMLVPYPGTELWEWSKRNGRFLENIEQGLHFADDPDKINIIFETDDFPAFERKKAYEMVHTLIGRFDMLISPQLSRWKYFQRRCWLLWNYDRASLPFYLFSILLTKFKGIIKRVGHLVNTVYSGKKHDRPHQSS